MRTAQNLCLTYPSTLSIIAHRDRFSNYASVQSYSTMSVLAKDFHERLPVREAFFDRACPNSILYLPASVPSHLLRRKRYSSACHAPPLPSQHLVPINHSQLPYVVFFVIMNLRKQLLPAFISAELACTVHKLPQRGYAAK